MYPRKAPTTHWPPLGWRPTEKERAQRMRSHDEQLRHTRPPVAQVSRNRSAQRMHQDVRERRYCALRRQTGSARSKARPPSNTLLRNTPFTEGPAGVPRAGPHLPVLNRGCLPAPFRLLSLVKEIGDGKMLDVVRRGGGSTEKVALSRPKRSRQSPTRSHPRLPRSSPLVTDEARRDTRRARVSPNI